MFELFLFELRLVCFRCGILVSCCCFVLTDCLVDYLLHAVTRFPDANEFSFVSDVAHEWDAAAAGAPPRPLGGGELVCTLEGGGHWGPGS